MCSRSSLRWIFVPRWSPLNGVGACDSISRKAMLEALTRVPGGPKVLPFVRLFCGQPSQYMWEDDKGVVHRIRQGEGEEQGDSLMPLFSLGQHAALDAVKARMVEGEVLLAFQCDVHVITKPDIWRFKRNFTDMPVSGSMPAKHRCGTQLVNNLRHVIFWSGLLRRKIRGLRTLGTPLGHVDCVQTQLTQKLAEHDVLLQRIPLVTDVQSAWSLLLHCAGGRANCSLRVVRPELVGRFGLGHNEGFWECLKRIMKLEGDVSDTVKDITCWEVSGFAVQLRPANQHSGRVGRTASP